jgi:hypothetical protein
MMFSEDGGEGRALGVVLEPAAQDVLDGSRVGERSHSEASKTARTTVHATAVKKTTTIPGAAGSSRTSAQRCISLLEMVIWNN